MSKGTRSTYSVIELGADGTPVRSYNAVITPYYAGEGPGQPPGSGGEPGVPTFPIAGYPDFPYPSQPIWLPGYPGGGRPPNLPGQPPSGGGQPPGIPTFPIAGYPDFPYPSQPIYRPGYPGGERPPSFPPAGGGGGGGGVPSPGPGVSAVVIPLPPTDPPTEPPEGMSPNSTQVLIWFGPGTLPAAAWVAPYPSQGPVEPPAEAK